MQQAVTAWLDRVQLGMPGFFERITVFPLFVPTTRKPVYVGLDEA